MVEMERRTITIDRRDQRAVWRGHIRQSRPVLVLLAVVVALFVVAAALTTVGRSPDGGWPLVAGGVIGVGVTVALLAGSLAALTRRQLPLGAQISLQVTADTLDLDGPAGADRIRWRQLSDLRRVGGGLFFTLAPSNARLGLPGRLIDDDALAVAVALSAGGGVAEEPADVSSVPSDARVLGSSIIFTAADQRVARAAMRRSSGRVFACLGGMVVLGAAGLAGVAAGLLRREAVGISAVVLGIALLSLVVIVAAQHRVVTRSLAIGTGQSIALLPDALRLTGPAGETRFAWTQLAELRRRHGAVTVRSLPTKTRLIFVGRLIDDELYAAIERRIRAAEDDRIGQLPG